MSTTTTRSRLTRLTHLARRAAAGGAAAALLTGGLGIAAAAPASAAPQDCSYMGYNSYPDQLGLKLDASEQKMFNDINAYRAANGVPALKVSPSLARPAMWMALDMATRTSTRSGHIDSRGMDTLDRFKYCGNYSGNWYGEILYQGSSGGTPSSFGGPRSEAAALEAWKKSPVHNSIMLDRNYTTVNVGFAYLGVNAEKGFWAVTFGDR